MFYIDCIIMQDTYVYYTGWNNLSLIVLLSLSSLALEVAVIIPETEIFEQLPKLSVESKSVRPIPDMGITGTPQEVW